MAVGFGQDIWCSDSLKSGRFARGPLLVAQALYRRLITPRGTLRGVEDEDDEANYGLDLASYVGAIGYPIAVAALPGLVEGELSKDDRVLSVAVSATQTLASNGEIDIMLEVDVELQDEQGSFTLTASVNAITTELVGVTVRS